MPGSEEAGVLPKVVEVGTGSEVVLGAALELIAKNWKTHVVALVSVLHPM